MAIRSLIRERFFPHLWCPGCGHGHVLNAMLHSVDDLGYDPSSLVMVSGIGCSARIAGYVDFHTMHTLHGRALAFATGIKMSRPDLHVIVPMGDGDALAIGGNHFIHAARRNIKLTAIVMNNRIYGMTGGQYSPLSGIGVSATTAPYGNIDREFDTVRLALGAGATFVARTTTYHMREMISIFKKALQHEGLRCRGGAEPVSHVLRAQEQARRRRTDDGAVPRPYGSGGLPEVGGKPHAGTARHFYG